MKLNPDCIRDILLCIESLDNVHYQMRFDDETIPELLPDYSLDEVYYHLRQCDLNNFLYKASHSLQGEWTVMDLTPKAHEFLANIREDTIWNDVKSVSSKIGSKSISTLTQIASGVVTALIKAQLNLP